MSERLPVVPEPCAGESLSSWLGQLVELYFGSERRLWSWMGIGRSPRDGDRPDAAHLVALAERTGVSGAQLAAMTLPWIETAPQIVHQMGLTIAPWRLGPFQLFDSTRRFCPSCLAARAPLWPLAWRIGGPVCLTHGVWLERACGLCGHAMPKAGGTPPRSCMRCATPYRVSPATKIDPGALGVFRAIDARINWIVAETDAARRRQMARCQDWLTLGRLMARCAGTTDTQLPQNVWRATFELAAVNAGKAGLTLKAVPAIDSQTSLVHATEAPAVERGFAPARARQNRRSTPPPSILDGLTARVAAALSEARAELEAAGVSPEPKRLRRHADEILRKAHAYV